MRVPVHLSNFLFNRRWDVQWLSGERILLLLGRIKLIDRVANFEEAYSQLNLFLFVFCRFFDRGQYRPNC